MVLPQYFDRLSGARFVRSVPELIAAIEEHIAVQNPKPFIWTAKANGILQKAFAPAAASVQRKTKY